MREKIAELLNWYGDSQPYVDWHVDGNDQLKDYRRQQAEEFLFLFLKEVEKLEPLSDEEIDRVLGIGGTMEDYNREIAQAQLTKSKQDLRKVME